MGKKTKRQQPRPKKKRVQRVSEKDASYMKNMYRSYAKRMQTLLKDKESLNVIIQEYIRYIEGIFRHYDTIQLLGGIGLYLIDNLPNIEKYSLARLSGTQMKLDESAEVIAEYALNFGLSIPNDVKEEPTKDIIYELKERLRHLYDIYRFIDMPLDNNAEQLIDWIILSETIVVRGDGYQEHLYQVFKELFGLHTLFYEEKYGFSVDELLDFFMDLENRLICKIGTQNFIYGPIKLYDRWVKWEEQTYGPIDDKLIENRDFSKGVFGDFLEANPDVGVTKDGQGFLLYAPDDYTASEKIFWVVPQNEAEKRIMD